MDLALSQEQLALQAAAAEAFGRFPPRRVLEGAGSGWDVLAASGWCGVSVPEDAGGAGLSMIDQALVVEAAGRVLHPDYWPAVATGALPLAVTGSGARLLPDLASGRRRAVLAFYEEPDRLDPFAPRASATRDGTGFRLDGRKVMVPQAAQADWVLCPVKMDGRVAVVAVTSSDLRPVPVPTPDLLRPYFDLDLTGVRVAGDALIVEPARGQEFMRRAFDVAVTGQCAELVGAAEQALSLTVAYAGERHQFGRPIGSFQAVKHRCAEMKIAIEAARSALFYAAWAVGAQDPSASLAVAVAKAFSAEALPQVGADALHLHGGMGFAWETEVHLYFRRILLGASYLGSATWHRARIAQALMDAQEVDWP